MLNSQAVKNTLLFLVSVLLHMMFFYWQALYSSSPSSLTSLGNFSTRVTLTSLQSWAIPRLPTFFPFCAHTDTHRWGWVRLEPSKCGLSRCIKVFIHYISFSPKRLGLKAVRKPREIILKFALDRLQVVQQVGIPEHPRMYTYHLKRCTTFCMSM